MLSQYNLHDYQVQRFKDKAFSDTERNKLLYQSLWRCAPPSMRPLRMRTSSC